MFKGNKTVLFLWRLWNSGEAFIVEVCVSLNSASHTWVCPCKSWLLVCDRLQQPMCHLAVPRQILTMFCSDATQKVKVVITKQDTQAWAYIQCWYWAKSYINVRIFPQISILLLHVFCVVFAWGVWQHWLGYVALRQKLVALTLASIKI